MNTLLYRVAPTNDPATGTYIAAAAADVLNRVGDLLATAPAGTVLTVEVVRAEDVAAAPRTH